MKRIPFKHWLSFLNDGIWRITEDEVSAKQKRTYNILKISFLAVQQFTEDKIMTRASALTYSTLLSIVPILAILFAIARGFGFDNLIESELRNSIANEQSELIITWVKSYLNHTKNGIFVGVGLIMLLWTILNLTDTIEQTFNYIWQVNKPRTLYRKITDYFSILLLLPLLFVISSGLSIFMSTFLKELDNFKLLAPLFQFAIRLIPYILIWGMFIGLYVFIPNTKVKLKHAIIPGIIAGTAFQAFQYIYIGSQIWVSGYNAIYGSFAAHPDVPAVDTNLVDHLPGRCRTVVPEPECRVVQLRQRNGQHQPPLSRFSVSGHHVRNLQALPAGRPSSLHRRDAEQRA